MGPPGHGRGAVYEERNTAWKLFLPVAPERSVLALGLDCPGLVSLGRSWRNVHVVNSSGDELARVRDMAEAAGLCTRYDIACAGNRPPCGYHAIAAVGCAGTAGSEMIWRLLAPGGAAVWAGHRADFPPTPSLVAYGYGPVRRYAVIPPATGKVIVPVSCRAAALTGLGFYVPLRARGRIASMAGRLASIAGCQGYLSPNQLVTAVRPGALPDGQYLTGFLSERLGLRVADVAMYPGSSSSDRRRVTLLAMDGTGGGVAVAKVADTLGGMAVNNKEAAVLDMLKQDGSIGHAVPGIIHKGDWQGHSVMVQEYVRPAGCRNLSGLTPAHTCFLDALSRLDRREAGLRDWPGWRRIQSWSKSDGMNTSGDADAVRKILKECKELVGLSRLTLHRIHGDFSPWNMFLDGGRLVVFDWEFSEPSGLPFYDLVHFVMRKRQYIDNKPLSPDELLTATPESLGVHDEVMALGASVPLINQAQGSRRRELTTALFRLSALYAAAVKTSVHVDFCGGDEELEAA